MSDAPPQPSLTKEESTQYRRWLQAASNIAADYNGSEQAYDSLLQSLIEIDTFIRSKHDGKSSPELESAYAQAVWPPELEKVPLTTNEMIDTANATHSRKLNSTQSFEDVLELIRQGGGVVMPYPGTFVQTDDGQLTKGATPSAPLLEKKTEPRLKWLVERLHTMGVYYDDLIVRPCEPDKHMVRDLPYYLVQIPRLDKEIMVCDQVGEITFVSNKILSPDVWEHSSKDELRALPEITDVKLATEEGWWKKIHGILSGEQAQAKTKKVDVAEFAGQQAPPKGDWSSGSDIEKLYVGNSKTIKAVFNKYRSETIELMMESGVSRADAEAEVEKNYVGIRAVRRGIETLCVSPAVVAELVATGKLTLLTEKAPPKGNWLSTFDTENVYIGSHQTLKPIFETYRTQKIAELVKGGMLPEDAKAEVEENYVGIRSSKGPESLCASPSVIRELEQNGTLKPLTTKAPPKGNWLSTSDTNVAYVGSSPKHNALFVAYRNQKIDALVKEGMSQENAAIAVEEKYIGIRSASGNESLCASPVAVIELTAAGKLVPLIKKAPPKGDWLSSSDTNGLYIDDRKHNALFEQYRQETIELLIESGISWADATAEVEKHYVGMRAQKHGQDVLSVSPQALAEMEQMGLMTSKGPPKGDWLAGYNIKNLYACSTEQPALFEQYRTQKIAELIGSGVPQKDAAAEVEANYIGMRSPQMGKDTLCVSPAAVAEMKTLGWISPKNQPKGNWLSSADLVGMYIGTTKKYIDLLKQYRTEKTAELIENGMSEADAAAKVEADYVGTRGGQASLCASPEVIAELEQRGLLNRREIGLTEAPAIDELDTNPDNYHGKINKAPHKVIKGNHK